MEPNLSAFLAANPGINLQTADLFGTDALAQYNWPAGADQKALLQNLRIRQRLLKVYPDDNVAAVLESAGIHSAHHIASLSEADIAQKVAPQLATLPDVTDTGALCAKIAGNAQRIRRASFELALAAPRTMELDVVDPSGDGTNPDFQEGIPDYQRLFGPMITCDCEECQSIFGPAAYFTDLMRVVTQYVTPPLEELFTLQYRRPDLWTIPLDCKTAETQVSYLDIVNGILLQNLQVNYTGGANPLQALAGMVYPFTAPYNQPLLTIRQGMESIGTSLAELYKLLDVSSPSAAAEILNLSPEQLTLVTSPGSVTLAQLYGFHDQGISYADLCDSLSNQKIFLQQTGLQPDQLEALVYQNLKRGNNGYTLYNNGSQSIGTIPIQDAVLTGSITIECWIYPTASYTQMSVVGKNAGEEFYIYLDSNNIVYCQYVISSGVLTFYSAAKLNLNVWTHIAWTRDVTTGTNLIYINGMLDSTHQETAANALESYSPISIGYIAGTSFHGATTELRLWSSIRTPSQIKANLYSRLKDYTETDLYAYWPLNEAEGTTVAEDLGPHEYNAGSANFTFYQSLPIGGASEFGPAVAHSLFLNGMLSPGQYITLTGADYTAKNPPQLMISDGISLTPLSNTPLSQLAVYIRLQAQTGWTFEELDWVLKVVAGPLTETPPVRVSDDIIKSAGQIAVLAKKYNIHLDELCSFLYDMKTYGRGNDAAPQDLWDRVFNTPPMMKDSANTSQTDYYRPVYTSNPLFSSPVISWTYKDSDSSQDQRLGNQLAAALGISGSDLGAIVNATGAASPISLSVENMSLFYRIARFAQLLKMKTADFISMISNAGLPLTVSSPYWSLNNVISICEIAEWLKKAKLTAAQLNYLTTADWSVTGLGLANIDTVDTAIASMINASTPLLVTPGSFVSDRVAATASQAIYQQLVATNYITDQGLVANVNELTPDNIYAALGATPVLSTEIFRGVGIRNCVEFLQGGQVLFNFDPFADTVIQSTNCFTMSLWVKPGRTLVSGWDRIIGNEQTSGDNEQKSPCIYQQQNVDGSIQLCYGYNGLFYNAYANVFQNDREWVFLSWVNNNGVWRLYRNGVLVQLTNFSYYNPAGVFQQTTNSPTYFIAASFTGSICNVAIWNTVRTADEIGQDMVNTSYSTGPDLVAWWPMDEGSGTTINNKSVITLDANGTLQGEYSWSTTDSIPAHAESAIICRKLQDMLAAQTALVIKSLAPVANISTEVMEGVCNLSGAEVDNQSAFGTGSSIPYAANMLLNADLVTNPNRNTYLLMLQRNAALTRWFRLNGAAVSAVANYLLQAGTGPVLYGTPFYTVAQLMTLSDYKALQSLCNQPNGLLAYFAMNDGSNTPTAEQLTLLAQLTGWDETELTTIVTQQQYFIDADVNFNTITGLRKLADVMAMEQKTGTGIVTLNLLRGLSEQNLLGENTDQYWSNYTDAATAVSAMLNTKSGATAVDKLNAGLAEQLRNVLCGWLIWELNADISGVKDQQELYEYLLIDVNMSSSVKSSWMVAAMNSLQLYVNRCINNLEPGAVNNIPQTWWQWMSTYRVWQANREVYLYPENYVDPTLRKFMSPQFRQFINDVSSGQVTDDRVKTAMASYLSSVEEVANINLVDGYTSSLTSIIAGTSEDNTDRVIYLVGRSRTRPYSYYTRTAVAVMSKVAVADGVEPEDATNMNFGAWEPVGLQINSDYLSIVAAFGRQFIFWAEQTKVKTSVAGNSGEPLDSGVDSSYTVVYATIYYSTRDFTNSWGPPVIVEKDIIIQVYGKAAGTIDYYSGYLEGSGMTGGSGISARAYYKDKAWNKVTVQFIPPSEHSSPGILLTIGSLVMCDTAITSKPVFTPASDLVPEAYSFQAQLYQAAKFAFKKQPHFVNIIQSFLLDAKLDINSFYISFNTSNAEFIEGGLVKGMDGYGLQFKISNDLLTEKLPTPLSWWPAANNEAFIDGNSITDIKGREDGTISGSLTWANAGMLPAFPNTQVPVFSACHFVFDWAKYGIKKHATISCWLNIGTGNGTTNSNLKIWWTDNPNSVTGVNILYQLAFDTRNNSLYVEFLNGSSTEALISTQSVTLNTWYLVVVTSTPDLVCIYLNNTATILKAPAPPDIFTSSSQGNLNFGNFYGMAFDIQFWNVALNAGEVQELYDNANSQLYLRGLHGNKSLQRLHNSAGSFVFNTGTQSYLVLPDQKDHLISNRLTVNASADQNIMQVTFSGSPLTSTELPAMRFIRVNTDTVSDFISALASGGVSALLSLRMQYLKEQGLKSFHPSDLVHLPESNLMNFNGAFSIYFWEIFFYAPYFIAEKLRAANKFSEAEKWYQYIFNPTSQLGPVACWPLNHSVKNQFPDLLTGSPGAIINLTKPTATSAVPFDYNPRNIWLFDKDEKSQVLVPYAALLNPDVFTITTWVNLTSLPSTTSYTIINSQQGGSGYHLFVKYVGNNTATFVFNVMSGSNGYVPVTSKYFTLPDKWIFIACTFDGSELRIFADGNDISLSKTAFTGAYIKNTSAQLSIGCGYSSTKEDWYFDGSIADMMLFAQPLTETEIRRLYKDYKNFSINAAYWNFRPFRRINAESLYHILNGDAWEESFFQPAQYYSASLQMAVYENDPFDPDTLARLRINPWQKATFMRYIDNLTSWGDSLFTQDTWETLSDATMRYVLASTLLGRVPVKEVTEDQQNPVNYNDIQLEYGSANVPQFLIEMENQLSGLGADATLPQQVQSIVDAYFCIPTNKQLLKYWELVADRLFKLRHGLTITGAQNNIPLYAAPIDPGALIAAVTAGGMAGASAVTAIPAVPAFRFSYMSGQARSVIAEVTRLGSELLAALEKKDAERLAQLQAGYQAVLNNFAVQIKASQINQLNYLGEGLQANLDNAVYMHTTYQRWLAMPINAEESAAFILTDGAMIEQALGMGIKTVAVFAYLFPTIFGLADGGFNPGESLNITGSVADGAAQLLSTYSQQMSQKAQFIRRAEEWELQLNIAASQIKEMQAQIAANNFALQAAQQEMTMTVTQLQQSHEVYDFLKTKFTNEELYDWMAGQLSTLYFQMFQLAWSLTQGAQTALQYELNLNQVYLNNAAWSASYQGLLAGDALSLALQQMENAYITGNNRKLEIRKTWSMRQNDPQALLTLVSTGNCRFDLTELSYALDFPGLYNRKIKSLSVTIPAVVGPYQNIHATLVQTGNAVSVRPNADAVAYLLGLSNNTPADGSLRINWNPNQEIIISTGINDSGVFQVNFNDEKYLPFEGTGAASSWSLSIPQAANTFPLRSISDVIITIDYTADDGGSTYASQVTSLEPLANYRGWQYLSMRQLYSMAWFNFCENPDGDVYSLVFELVTQMYPANLGADTIKLGNNDGEIVMVPVLQPDYSDGGIPVFSMNGSGSNWSDDTCLMQITNGSVPVPVPGKGNPWMLTATFSPGSGLLTNGKIDQTKLLDIILVVPFSGTLSW